VALEISVTDLSLAAIDALDVDALGVFVTPERPLQGLAGFADWRLCGAISRALRAGTFEGAEGEALLLPSGGRLAAPRVVCFGLSEVPLPADRFLRASRVACETLARAGSVSCAISPPPISGGDASLAARLWLEAALVRPVRRLVLLADARVWQRELLAARAETGADVEVVVPTSRVEMPGRPRPLPHAGTVVR
jgi:hypothetical protein